MFLFSSQILILDTIFKFRDVWDDPFHPSGWFQGMYIRISPTHGWMSLPPVLLLLVLIGFPGFAVIPIDPHSSSSSSESYNPKHSVSVRGKHGWREGFSVYRHRRHGEASVERNSGKVNLSSPSGDDDHEDGVDGVDCPFERAANHGGEPYRADQLAACYFPRLQVSAPRESRL